MGFEPDSNVYCYGKNDKSCLITNTCNSDNDCRGNYTVNSPKLNYSKLTCPDDITQVNFTNSTSWLNYACPNNYSRVAAQLPVLRNPNFNDMPQEAAQEINVISEFQQNESSNEGNQIANVYQNDQGPTNYNQANSYGSSTEPFMNNKIYTEEQNKNGNYYLILLVAIIIIVFLLIYFTFKIGKKNKK